MVTDDHALFAAMCNLQPGQRIRVYRLTEGAWQNAIWAFRDTHEICEDGSRINLLEYYHDGAWHETEEGISFDAIAPWRQFAPKVQPVPATPEVVDEP